MTRTRMLAGGLAIALALPAVGVAQMADHGAQGGDGMPMMQDGMMPEAMREQMEEMMRPMMQGMMQDMMRSMMQDMMRGMMGETQTGEAAPADADADPAAGHGAQHAAGGAPAGSPATQAYRAANLAMHAAMDFEFTDNADIDFARGMIGHHQGAIDMARIVLEHGQDPQLRQLAEEVIAAQEAEIDFLQGWIAENAE